MWPLTPTALTTTLLILLNLTPSTTATLANPPPGLNITITRPVVPDCTRKTTPGDTISVHYKGTLLNGKVFDSSYPRKSPFKFRIGAGQVIKGWDEGLLEMCIGEGRKLVIAPELGYGGANMGVIPPHSTLVFETELMGIEGVKAPEVVKSSSTTAAQKTEAAFGIATAAAEPTATSTAAASAEDSEDDHDDDDSDDNGECRLLGPFALLIQGALGVLALSSLVFKRWREHPRRPLKIWWFDVSKQVFGSVLLHLANLFMSMFSSGSFDIASAATAAVADQPNPCSFYLLNLAIDTTIGIPILVTLLKISHALFLRTPLANPPESLKSGFYGHPPRATWWLKQSLIYFLGLFGMKLCVFFIFQLLPWIAWVGDWALRWTEGNEALQIAFVMLVFPLIMNGLQYYIIDGFIKGKGDEESQGYEGVAGEESEDGDEDDGASFTSDVDTGKDGVDEEAMDRRKNPIVKESSKEAANPTPVPAGNGASEYQHGSGESSSSNSVRGARKVS